ncbi:alpha-N-acetylneuraminide alpha-2,8-sialyltransferase-like [Ptychodera flava]|uniref:alpha-N-acetylneuraminide alpha-2,8-sialyltransferase-like n=1 Tax=Ptychodera flava TaxID=63121 RepID=UPI00396A06EB
MYSNTGTMSFNPRCSFCLRLRGTYRFRWKRATVVIALCMFIIMMGAYLRKHRTDVQGVARRLGELEPLESGTQHEERKRDVDLKEHIMTLKRVYRALEEPWQLNQTTLRRVRSKLQDQLVSARTIFFTKRTTHVGTERRFPRKPNETFTVNKNLYNHLIQENPLNLNGYRKCNVVGNSGILVNSQCGERIDGANFIFRCNLQPLHQYSRDAGIRSNLSTLNPSVLWVRYQRLENKKSKRLFTDIASQYSGVVAIPTGGASGLKWSLRAMDELKKSSVSAKVALIDPQHILSVREFWKHNVTGTISTGMYLTTLALILCEEIHLYGFWPFSYNQYGQPIPFHYTDDLQKPSIHHHMSDEFNLLMKLHQAGVLHVHVERCT